MADCTSTAAPSRLRDRSNWIVMLVDPSWLVEVIWVMPEIVLNWRSRGVATDDAIVSGLAPGKAAFTWIVGKSTLGKSLTGRARYAKTPKITIATISSVVMMGRRMNRAVTADLRKRGRCRPPAWA